MKAGVFKAVGKRCGRGLIALGLAISLTGMVVDSSLAAGNSDLIKVRFGGDGASTRVVLDIGQSSQAKIISTTPTGLVLELPRIKLGDEDQGMGHGLVRAWSADARPGAVRIKIDLDKPVVVEKRFLLTPSEGQANYRYVIDLKAVGAVKPAAPVVIAAAKPAVKSVPGAPAAKPAQVAMQPVGKGPVANMPIGGASFPSAFSFSSRAEAATLTPTGRSSVLTKRTIVIDAGHGGHDPGALGGVAREKDLTLAAALAVKARLEATGRYRVVMTRSSDVFVPLENRVQIARKANADLFISMHADAGSNKETRGASVYTLSDSGSQRVVKGVSRDNDWFSSLNLTSATRAVREIIMDMTQRATRNQSAQFADLLLQRLNGHAPLLTRAHRDAGYMVLLAPDVPAVLLEMGFVTNPDDERFLSTTDTRGRLAGAVVQAIDDYFSDNLKLAMN
jgi:N-acetylmuramoyl-L-alanine amidase